MIQFLGVIQNWSTGKVASLAKMLAEQVLGPKFHPRIHIKKAGHCGVWV